MKNYFILSLLLCSSGLFAQKIDGFYTGVLNNDSANRMVQQYELAIAMYKGKITGYSYVTFIVKDTFYYGIRKVKGEIVGDSIVVEDDKFVSNNFPESPAKGVKRTITIPLNGQDSLTALSGKWKTNQTKRYYSVPGSIELAKSKDSMNSPLINHLKELGIVSTENYMVTAAAETKTNKTGEPKQPVVTSNNVAASNDVTASTSKKKDKKDKNKSTQQTETAKGETKPGQDVAKQDSKTKQQSGTVTSTTSNQQTEIARQDSKTNQQTGTGADTKSNQQTEIAKQDNKSKQQAEKTKQDEKQAAILASNTGTSQTAVTQTVNTQSSVTKTSTIQTATKTELPKTIVMPEKPGYQKRSTVVTKSVEVTSDSLVLAFYDNGVVDGDSISVYLNGELIVPSTKLKTVATKTTISVTGKDEIKLVLVADNLGSIPPNTGLMSIRDGDNIYQVHFSADMQTNASIIIRRKKN